MDPPAGHVRPFAASVLAEERRPEESLAEHGGVRRLLGHPAQLDLGEVLEDPPQVAGVVAETTAQTGLPVQLGVRAGGALLGES